MTGLEPELGMPLPGATPTEVRAALTWNLRSALNVAALQCDFAPTLLTVDHYNAMLKDHNAELKASFDTLNGYFVRTAKTKAAGQSAFDRFGTRTYSAFSTVAAQYGFCQTASKIGSAAIFAPRGQLGDVAVNYMREMRNSLIPYGEQQFPRAFYSRTYLFLPDFQPDLLAQGPVQTSAIAGREAEAPAHDHADSGLAQPQPLVRLQRQAPARALHDQRDRRRLAGRVARGVAGVERLDQQMGEIPALHRVDIAARLRPDQLELVAACAGPPRSPPWG